MSTTFDDCLSSPGAEFYREVVARGEHFATLRAIRPLDNDRIMPMGSTRIGANGTIEFTDRAPGPVEIRLRKLVCRLGGELDGRSTHVGDEGWVINATPTVDTINGLPADVLKALLTESDDMDEQLEKRLEAYSGN